jgi:hypothetical protein
MRRGLMIVAFLLPIVLWVWGLVWSGKLWPLSMPQSSMSYYYYYGDGAARDVFVGALWAIGVFLILYKPPHRIENFLLNVAGFAACAIALFPMNQDGDCKDSPLSLHSTVHGISAVVFFSAITLVCIFFPAKHRGRTWACAGFMVAAIVIAVLYKFVLGTAQKAFLCSWSTIFWIELVAVLAFAKYWHLKSLDMDDSLKQLIADAAAKVTNAAAKVADATTKVAAATARATKHLAGFGRRDATQAPGLGQTHHVTTPTVRESHRD